MVLQRYFTAFFLMLFLSGCLWSGRAGIKDKASNPADSVSVQVIREDLWASGGPIVFFPLTPGAKAEAGEATDRLSLMIVKGAADFFSEKDGVFQLIADGDVNRAAFLIEGHIDEFDGGSKWKTIGIGKKDVTLKVSGEIRERKTGEIVALVFGFKSFKKVKDAGQMAHDLGRSLGEKIQH